MTHSDRPTIEWETKFGYPSELVVGVDEVGRGCLAGPVAAGAVVLPRDLDEQNHPWVSEITDSKALSPRARERLAPLIRSWAMASSVAMASVEDIERINIYHASHLAMKYAIQQVSDQLLSQNNRIAHILIDGNALPRGLKAPATAIIQGDLKSLSIAAASILAKVERDRLMVGLDKVYPGYGFAAHKGYSTAVHVAALKNQGACPIHRKNFAPVAAVSLPRRAHPGRLL